MRAAVRLCGAIGVELCRSPEAIGMERRKARRITRASHSGHQCQGPAHRSGWIDVDPGRQNRENPHRNQTDSDMIPFSGEIDEVASGFVEMKPPGPGLGPGVTRRVRGGRRDRRYAEMLVERAAWIPSSDRSLIEAVHGEGLSVVAYVRRCLDRGVEPVERDAFGKTALENGRDLDAWARMARRRLRRLNDRLASDRFAFVIARRNAWPTTRRRVAVTCTLHGRSLRAASRELGLSLHTVRRHAEAIEAMFEAYREAGVQARSAVEAALADGVHS